MKEQVKYYDCMSANIILVLLDLWLHFIQSSVYEFVLKF